MYRRLDIHIKPIGMGSLAILSWPKYFIPGNPLEVTKFYPTYAMIETLVKRLPARGWIIERKEDWRITLRKDMVK
jgi:hypothetical protein